MTTLTQGLYSVRYIKRIDCNTKVKRGLELRRKTSGESMKNETANE